MFEAFIAFNVALLAAVASPGPALLVALQTSVSAGRQAGMAVGLGLATMASLWTLMALLGLDAVFAMFPWAYGVIKLVGALYLLYVAWTLWTGATQSVESTQKDSSHRFLQGLLINALNPKSVLFAAAVLVVIFPSNMRWQDNLAVVANHFVVEVIFYALLAVCMNTQRLSRAYLSAKSTLDRFAAVVLGGLGIRLLAGD